MELFNLVDVLLKGGPGLVALVFMYLVWIKYKDNNDDIGPKVDEIADTVEKLYEMHNTKDEDGVYVWHLRKSMMQDQRDIRDVLQDLHVAIRDIHRTQETQTKVLERLIDKLVK